MSLAAPYAGLLTHGRTRWRAALDPMTRALLATTIARAFLAGEPGAEAMAGRAGRAIGSTPEWLSNLAGRCAEMVGSGTRPRERDLVRILLADRGFRRAWARYGPELRVEHWVAGPGVMRPAEAALGWDLPAIATAGDLAVWLGLSGPYLDWLADLKGLPGGSRAGHYHYRVLEKPNGSIRVIEAPKPMLKAAQRQILSGIAGKIPAHEAAHGFRKGRSILTFAAVHTALRVVLRMDLRDFFPSIAAARVQALFRTAGYPEHVSDLLGGLCTNSVPRQIGGALYSRRHLPQGAPTSPALANACAYRADCRLSGLAEAAGARYTRYADDLAFSGGPDFERCAARFAVHAAVVLEEEGFAVNHRKTRIMRQSVRQHLAGVVVNARVNVRRTDVDRLKAILTNCMRFGPESQNRAGHPDFRAHLQGRVAFVEQVNRARGHKLRALFDAVRWS